MPSYPLIPHSRPTLGEDEIQALAGVIRSGQVAQGPRVEEFERGIAAFIGVQGGVAVSSGTAALEIALLAVGVGPGDEVLLPSYVCAAPCLAAVRIGAQPRLVDIESDTYAIDPAEAAKAVSSRTRAIIVPHPFGLPADLDKLRALEIPLIEDCAQALGATIGGRQVGSLGEASVCSFYATKLLCTGEGGMVLSNDPTILEKARLLRAYDEEPKLEPTSFNHKMTDLQAALGLSQLARYRSFLDQRQALARRYHAGLSQADLALPQVSGGRTHVYYRYVVGVRRAGKTPRSVQTLDALLRRMERRGVQCRRPVFRPLHRYLNLDGYPETEQASRTALSLPIYPSMTEEEQVRTVQTLCEELA